MTEKTIPGVPESLSLEQFLSIFEAIGLEPSRVISLSADYRGIRVKVFSLDEHGRKFLIGSGDTAEVATDWVWIPVPRGEIDE